MHRCRPFKNRMRGVKVKSEMYILDRKDNLRKIGHLRQTKTIHEQRGGGPQHHLSPTFNAGWTSLHRWLVHTFTHVNQRINIYAEFLTTGSQEAWKRPSMPYWNNHHEWGWGLQHDLSFTYNIILTSRPQQCDSSHLQPCKSKNWHLRRLPDTLCN